MSVSTFGQHIKEIREKQKELSFSQVEEKSKMYSSEIVLTPSYVSALEQGRISNPSIDRIILLSKVYEEKDLLIHYFSHVGLEGNDKLLRDFIGAYLNLQKHSEDNLKFANDLFQYIVILYRYLCNRTYDTTNDAEKRKKIKKGIDKIINTIKEVIKNGISDADYMAEYFGLQIMTVEKLDGLENVDKFDVILKLTTDKDFELLISLKDWFKKLRDFGIKVVRYILIDKEIINDDKHLKTLIEFGENYFSYPQITSYLIDVSRFQNEAGEYCKNFGRFYLKSNDFLYQIEESDKLTLLPVGQEKEEEKNLCDRAIKFMMEKCMKIINFEGTIDKETLISRLN